MLYCCWISQKTSALVGRARCCSRSAYARGLPVEEIQLIKSSVSVANLMRGLQGTDEDRCASHSYPARGVTHLHGQR